MAAASTEGCTAAYRCGVSGAVATEGTATVAVVAQPLLAADAVAAIRTGIAMVQTRSGVGSRGRTICGAVMVAVSSEGTAITTIAVAIVDIATFAVAIVAIATIAVAIVAIATSVSVVPVSASVHCGACRAVAVSTVIAASTSVVAASAVVMTVVATVPAVQHAEV